LKPRKATEACLVNRRRRRLETGGVFLCAQSFSLHHQVTAPIKLPGTVTLVISLKFLLCSETPADH
jgi:hypothetical protein